MSTPIVNGMATVYTNETPFDTDVLRCGLYKMVDIAQLAQTVLGTGLSNITQVNGLACAPISPPGLQVTVGPGRIYAFVDYLATSWAAINSDTTTDHMLYKQGISLDTVTLSTPAPAGGGNNIIYLVQAQFEEIDTNSVSRPYFNPSNPTAPVYMSADDTRQQTIIINIKAGAAAPSPSPPSPDAGFTALYYVAVANGQTSIISGNITTVPGAPFITESLPQKAKTTTVQYSGYNYSADTGTANVYAATLSPVATAYTVGLQVYLKVLHANTAASTLNVNGLGTKTITLPDGSALRANDMIVGQLANLMYDGTNFQLQNPINGILADVPPGTILPFGGTSAPAGYLECDGSSKVAATYPALFAAIGYSWGGAGANFTLPNFADKAPVGHGSLGVVGASGGALTSAALLAHSHPFNGGEGVPTTASGWSRADSGGGGGAETYPQTGGHVTVNNITATESVGSGSSFSIVQPYAAVLMVIKT